MLSRLRLILIGSLIEASNVDGTVCYTWYDLFRKINNILQTLHELKPGSIGSQNLSFYVVVVMLGLWRPNRNEPHRTTADHILRQCPSRTRGVTDDIVILNFSRSPKWIWTNSANLTPTAKNIVHLVWSRNYRYPKDYTAKKFYLPMCSLVPS